MVLFLFTNHLWIITTASMKNKDKGLLLISGNQYDNDEANDSKSNNNKNK